MNTDQIKARAEKATPGPWEAIKSTTGDYSLFAKINRSLYMLGDVEETPDADFIAHAREDIPALLEEAERLHGELKAYNGMKPAGVKMLQENCKELHEICREHQQERMELQAQLEHLTAYRKAEEQGLLVTLPCKVGDTVYVVCKGRFINSGKFRVSDYDSFGKTVFLTREEVEAKL